MNQFNYFPSTLRIAIILMYLRAATILIFEILMASYKHPIFYILTATFAIGAYGCSKKSMIGYYVAIGACITQIIRYSILLKAPLGFLQVYLNNPVAAIFDIALLALLLHTMTRSYVKSNFK